MCIAKQSLSVISRSHYSYFLSSLGKLSKSFLLMSPNMQPSAIRHSPPSPPRLPAHAVIALLGGRGIRFRFPLIYASSGLGLRPVCGRGLRACRLSHFGECYTDVPRVRTPVRLCLGMCVLQTGQPPVLLYMLYCSCTCNIIQSLGCLCDELLFLLSVMAGVLLLGLCDSRV